jgi:hydroxysqualene synthase
VSGKHYENFPVASWLCPPALRPAVSAIYGFARTADDIADEGEAAASERLEALAAFRADLGCAVSGQPASSRWPEVFLPLARAIDEHALPGALLAALLDAFEQDVVKSSYADRDELLAYCRRSANPVGRLLLHLYEIDEAESLARSDAICTALQLVNFWQDLGVDTARGRLYVPEADCRRFGLEPREVLAGQDSPRLRALILELVAWTRELMLSGAALVHTVPGRAGLELRLVVQGGLRILERIDQLQGATCRQRPTVGWKDAPTISWRALAMRPDAAALAAARPRQGRPGRP